MIKTFQAGSCEVAVIGAGHAGIEAALAAARQSAGPARDTWCGSWMLSEAKWGRQLTRPAFSIAC